jgi:hypothetical protein
MDVELHASDFFGAGMRESLKACACFGYALLFMLSIASDAQSQTVSARDPGSTCAALLAGDATTSANAPSANVSDSAGVRGNTATASSGTPQSGAPDILLEAAVQANEVRFAAQPQVRVRLCWGGDTLRVVQRTNIPSPVVAGTTYRNVFVAVELLGNLNAACLTERIAAGRESASVAATDSASPGSCAFLGLTGAAGQQPPRQP